MPHDAVFFSHRMRSAADNQESNMTTTILDSRSFIERIAAVVALDYQRDEDTRGGYVAKIDGGRDEAMAAIDVIDAAGLDADTSWSRDDDGVYYVWVAPRDIYAAE